MAQLIGGLGVLWWMFGLVMMLLFAYLVPFSIFVTMRNIKKIRVQFERLNDNIEAGRLAPRPYDEVTRGDLSQRPIRSGAGIGSLRS